MDLRQGRRRDCGAMRNMRSGFGGAMQKQLCLGERSGRGGAISLPIGPYLARTQHLTRDEHGAYLLLLLACSSSAQGIPDDDHRLAGIARASAAEWSRLRPRMREYFLVENGSWFDRYRTVPKGLHRGRDSQAQRSQEPNDWSALLERYVNSNPVRRAREFFPTVELCVECLSLAADEAPRVYSRLRVCMNSLGFVRDRDGAGSRARGWRRLSELRSEQA